MSRSRSAVDLGHRLAVRSAGGFKGLVPFGEFAAQIESLLLRLGGPVSRRLAMVLRERRNEYSAFDVCLADVRLDGQRELHTLARGMRRDRAAILVALTTTHTSGAVEVNVTV
ncbi:hypothetical protein OKJ48_29255 [Streptomyces kunmingensis]|uniref:Uncharacterized protein n=1 Tax=Streptomyces kunmingensis TaxID=68225 RepID=A0ABU6CHW7_9ACTN|nr:hypothetical protein [Streptomyces kunmingensis]MEB3964293.1 hypothetical protein [Streptomyces kunmingensis]